MRCLHAHMSRSILPLARAYQKKLYFQIMPQLLYYLKLDSAHSGPAHSNDIDWGTLLIYTCGAGSCKLGRGYHTEFLWKQEVS